MSGPFPPHLADQVDAAAAEAALTLDRIGAHLDGTRGEARTDSSAGHLVGVLRFRLAVGAVRVCPHLAHPRRAWWVAWVPDRLSCDRCFRALAPEATIAGTVEDRTCDGCRQVVDVIHPTWLAFGPLVVVAGLCESCVATSEVA